MNPLRILILAALLISASAVAGADASDSTWEPRTTWVFAVSCMVYKLDKTLNLTKMGREAVELVDIFKVRGVPEDHIVFLQDKAATLAEMKRSFAELLGKTREGDTLIFYFHGHGARVIKDGKSIYSFSHYECQRHQGEWLHVGYLYDMIEKHFKGSGALMLADCCHSGGLATVARHRSLTKTYACLNSTYAHQVSRGGTYTASLIRGFRGDAAADLDRNGEIELKELARYAEERMAFVEEKKAGFATFNGFDPAMKMATAPKKADPQVGRFVEAKQDGKWYKAEIEAVKDGKLHVKYVDYDEKEWVTANRIRDYQPKQFEPGAKVMAKCENEHDKWRPATVLKAWHGLHFVHFDGEQNSAEDEWEAPDRIHLQK